MATRLKNILNFTGLGVGVPVSLPHNLNVDGVGVIPDFVVPQAGNFGVVADATNVTVTRNVGDPDNLLVYVEHWHTIVRDFGQASITALTPAPFVQQPGVGLGSGLSGIVRADVGDEFITATSETDLYYDDTIALATDLPCHAAGSVVGLAAKYGGVITAGDINVHVAKRSNGTGPPVVLGPGVLQVVLNSINGIAVVATFPPGVHTFNQGDTLTVTQTASAALAPTAFDLTASILMRYN